MGWVRRELHLGHSSIENPYRAKEDDLPVETYNIIPGEDWQDICPEIEESIRRLRLQELLSESEVDEFDNYILTVSMLLKPFWLAEL